MKKLNDCLVQFLNCVRTRVYILCYGVFQEMFAALEDFLNLTSLKFCENMYFIQSFEVYVMLPTWLMDHVNNSIKYEFSSGMTIFTA